MNGKKVDFVIDSGTESTVLCEEAHRRIGSPLGWQHSRPEDGHTLDASLSLAGKLPAENAMMGMASDSDWKATALQFSSAI
uniref:Peptidase A2 domain-containing protein n=1 Tax=Globodera rostochiensis TaxID=31243 RepID=A0A914HAC1_GLORO